jgi:hypothetical protein
LDDLLRDRPQPIESFGAASFRLHASKIVWFNLPPPA